jgi:ubiquinone/menaquinone biosynthesis C-methylase UbiE
MLSVEEIKLLVEKLEKIKSTDFEHLIDNNLQLLKNLQKYLDDSNEHLKLMETKNMQWFGADLEYKKERPVVTPLLAKTIQSKIWQFAKTNKYSCLEIGPGNGQFSMDFRAWKSNYFIDIIPGYSKSILKRFPKPHHKYLHFLQTNVNGSDISQIPQGSCNFVFSWDTFVFLSMTNIQQYLHEISRILIPGGFVFVQYADCHYDYDLEQAKRSYWQYNTKYNMSNIIKEEGYKIIEMHQFCPGANYAIFQKDGNKKTLSHKMSELKLD